ncbi:hypothetical protein I6A60_37025 [Frankia sp. AgB1.9]|uniref:hypothetical protein n=1 Tax=unclassified Frankia TaxID=2632575 RepID=UPI001931C995|nr:MULTISPECIES: hypothetical protein [unclassified Frankia]MBL7493990.1 hypothetical protein [Frankia sp. AgW1.1]MBL7553411.1 hypothetical protein [Frankia sp. AgB1.9]MBL7622302.1 hypothetical protein [Frankia sp. AgB1.8]
MKRILASTVAATCVATAGLVALVPTAASAATSCRPTQYISIHGGKAEVHECTSGGRVQVEGWVEDTNADGKCAQVYASYNNYSGKDYSSKACPDGDIDEFLFPWRAGTDAYIYLRLV